jgi:flagellar basal-body rod protein FlgG
MRAQQLRIDNIANNLANVSTTGYKKARETFEDLVYQNYAVGSAAKDSVRPSGLAVGTGTRLTSMVRDFTNGDLAFTGNEFDLGISGRGFFAVESPDGLERYTRDGSFQKNADGELVTSAGFRLQPGIEIPEDAERVGIAADGTVEIYYKDAYEPVAVGTIELVDFINPAGLMALGGNLYAPTPESGEPIDMDASDGHVSIQQGFQESSNVDMAEELIQMIYAQRAYELSSKVVETADQQLQVVNSLKR